MKETHMKSFFAALLALVICIPGAACADEKIRGKYEVIGDLESLKGATHIEMVEFFNYSCGHCYKFLESSKRLHEKFKDKLHHKKQPIYWGQQTPYPAMAFYIADDLGMEEKFTQELFDTNFKLQINIFQPKVIRFLAKEHDIEKEMTEGMKSDAVQKKVQQSLQLAKKYKANETPTVIINGVLKVTPNISGGDVEEMTKNLDIIFEDILAKK